MPEAMGNWLGWYEEAAHNNNREEAARVEREAEREVEREEWWAMRQDVVRRVREDVRSGGWHRWVMDSGEVWSVGLEEAERCMAVAEAEAGAAKHEAEEATAAAVWWRGADRWGAGPAAAAQRRVVRGAELTAAMAEETRGGIRAVAGWMEVAERGTDRMAWQLCMVADAVAWAVEEWGEAEAAAVSWRLAAREVEEAREAERALWSEVEERRREDRELVDATNALATALEGVAAEVEVAAEVAVTARTRSEHRDQAPSGHR